MFYSTVELSVLDLSGGVGGLTTLWFLLSPQVSIDLPLVWSKI